ALLLYDGVASEADLDAWLPPGGARCHVLATSTNRYWTRRHVTCSVPLLPDDDAGSLAATLLGDTAVALGYAEPLIRHAGGLAVQLCANAAAVARAVAHGRAPDLDRIAVETQRSFETAWRLLPADAKLLLRVAALFEGSRIPVAELRALLEEEG